MVSSAAAGASTRTRSPNRWCASARWIARSRSGRSGCPAGVRCWRQAGCVTRRVGIGLIRKTYPCSSFARNGHAWWRRWLIGHEERWRERLAGGHAIFVEVGDALGGQEGVVDQKIAGEAACRLLEHEIGCVGHDFGYARHPHHPLAAEQVFDGGGRNGRARPERIHRDAFVAQLAGETQHDEAHAVLGNRIGGAAREPFFAHVERRGNQSDVWGFCFLAMRKWLFS